MEKQRQRKDNEGSRNSKFLQGGPERRSFIIVLSPYPMKFSCGSQLFQTEIQDMQMLAAMKSTRKRRVTLLVSDVSAMLILPEIIHIKEN